MKQRMYKTTALAAVLVLLIGMVAIFPVAAETEEFTPPSSYYVRIAGADGTPTCADNVALYTVPSGTMTGYAIFKAVEEGAINPKKGAAGTLTYMSEEPMTDWHMHLIKSTLHLKATVEISKDGAVWEAYTPTEIEGEVHANAQTYGQYTDYYGTFDAADGYHGVRVTLDANPWGGLDVPAIEYFEYSYDFTFPDSYEVRAVAAQGTPSCADGVALTERELDGGDVGMYAAFETVESGKVGAAGAITYQSEYPITDFHVNLLQNTLNGKAATIEISKDGTLWESVMLIEVAGDPFANSSWFSYFTDYYATLDAGDGYCYIRINLPPNDWNVLSPALGYVEYIREGEPVEVPVEYDIIKSSSKYSSISDADLYKGVNGTFGDCTIGDVTYPAMRFSNGTATAGWLVFDARTTTKYFNVCAALFGRDQAQIDAFTFDVSADGTNWTSVTATATALANLEQCDDYFYRCFFTGKTEESFRYLRVNMAAVNVWGPSINYVQFVNDDPNGGLIGEEDEDEDDSIEGVLPESPDIEDLELPYAETLFSEKKSNGLFKANNMGISSNGNKNSPYFGTTHSLIAQSAKDAYFIMYTPNVRDFKFTLAANKDGSKLVVKAYGRTEQYGEETEIPLMRTANLRPADKGDGVPWYQFRVKDRANMAQNYQYIRVEIVDAIWTNCMNFTYFYDGPEPGEVPADERPHILDTLGTEREGVETLNGNKGDFRAEYLEHMAFTGNGGNSNFIGCIRGALVYPDNTKDGLVIFRTEAIDKFWVKFCCATQELAEGLIAYFYVAPTVDAAAEEWTQIPVTIEACPDSRQPTGWKAMEMVSTDDAVFPVGSNYLKIVLPAAENNYTANNVQIARVDYTYSIPETESLPSFAEPDTESGEEELFEDFSSSQLLKENGGLAEEAEGVEWMEQHLGTYNGTDKVYYKTDFIDSYIVYKASNITSIDIRGYRHKDAIEDLLVYVSSNGEDWIELTDFIRTDVELYGGPINYSHRITNIPEEMNYVKIMYPEFAGALTDITVSDIQILYNSAGSTIGTDSEIQDQNNYPSPDTGTEFPWTALCLLALSGAMLLGCRKHCAI